VCIWHAQFIVELETGNDNTTDLTGDAGVVGRWLVEGDEKEPLLKMDLKGIVYTATTASICPPFARSARCH
jgi:hypothetical protein